MTYRDEIIRLSNEGKSYNQIKDILGCSKGTIAYYLGAGQKEKTLSRQRDKRNIIIKYIQEYKQSRVCTDCKENYPYWMMEFDHLGNKSFTISASRQRTSNLEEIKKEIEKCEVVCSNCHKNRTHLRLIKNGEGSLDLSDVYN